MNHNQLPGSACQKLNVGDIALRLATQVDRPLCKELFIETHQAPLQHAGWDEMQRRAFLLPQFDMREQVFTNQYPQADHYIIQVDEVEVGRMLVNRSQYEIYIIDIAILDSWRRHGIGSYLLANICAEADDKQKTIRLQVANDNPALNLYQGYGFEAIDNQGVYTSMERKPDRASSGLIKRQLL